MNVLFVCTGNTCRSPMAEALLKHRAQENIQVKSCGITAIPGTPMSSGTTEVLRQEGIEINHQATPINKDLMQWADLILTMTAAHKEILWSDYPEAREKTYTLKEFAIHADIEIWNQLKDIFAELEEKRKHVLKQQNSKINPIKQSQLLHEIGREEMEAIRDLKRQLTHSDIVDPFGRSTAHYLKTKQEIEWCLNQWLSP